jgi:hypothetical protein
VVGEYIKKSEYTKLFIITATFKGKIKIRVHQTLGVGNVWFIFKPSELKILGLNPTKHYWVFINDGELVFKVKLRKYKPYYAFWINAQYLPKEVYAIHFEEVVENE